MADDIRQNLTDIAPRTATADTDLIHVNSGGTDYKQTKKNFTFDLVQYHEFNNTDTLTSQCDSLATSGKSPAYYVGKINSYGHQSATGVPFNHSYHVQLSIYSASYIELTLTDVDDGGVFRKIKSGGTWQSSWTMQPTRSEISAINNSLTNSLALKITSTAPNLSNTAYSANSIKVMSVTAPTDINQLINVTIIGDYPSGSRQNLIAVSSWLYSGNVYVAIRNITSSSITATLQVQILYIKSD